MDVQAYFEEWSRLPGETVRMAISTKHESVRATLERITRGPSNEDSGNASRSFGVPIPGLDVTVPGVEQPTAVGSYAELPLGGAFGPSFALHFWFYSSVPGWDDPQTLVAGASGEGGTFALAIQKSELVASVRGQSCSFGLTVQPLVWYSAVLSVDCHHDKSEILLHIKQVKGLPGPAAVRHARVAFEGAVGRFDKLLLATRAISPIGSAADGFNGKIDSPVFFYRALVEQEYAPLLAGARGNADLAWSFAENFRSREIREVAGRAPNGVIRNGAERAVTGRNWTGLADSFVAAPDEYGAIYFHSDEMIDSGWDYNLSFELPKDLKSGVYAVRLEVGGRADLYPLFVRATNEGADVVFVAPTNTYLAYANDHFAASDMSAIMGHERVVSEDEAFINAHPEFGLSCYDRHRDGSPVRYSSRRRPLLNTRPHYPNWLTGSYRHFPVDLFFLAWLERLPHSYHVVTDEDVHARGSQLLSKYKVVVTGSHPEYWTNKALTALENYALGGGRILYLGGNGLYWVTSIDPDRPWIIEVRRDNSGLRSWDAPIGERNHVHTGEPGGLWRYRGRGPNTLVGVGFATEGFSKGKGYKRAAASYEPQFKAFFDGVSEDVIGEEGYILDGAASDECDRYDLALGSPAHATILASATGFGPEYLMVPEDLPTPMPNSDGPNRPDKVRADMVYVPIAGGGEIFSVGSIGFVGAMAWNDFKNNTARLLDNVLAEFVLGTNAGRIKVETEPSSEGSRLRKVAPRHADRE
jgi:N,N-dimethylformamidase